MHILISNDDGIDSEGLLALRAALAPLGEVAVIAPERNWSAAGHTKTLDRPLRVREVRLRDGAVAYASDGAPSDCVALGALGFLGWRPDLVVSGINKGLNLGGDITYSGTVAAAMEAVIGGIPGIAVSLDYHRAIALNEPPQFATAAAVAAALVEQALARGLASDVLLNVCVPHVPRERVAGVRITRLGMRRYKDELVTRTDPFGRHYYWIAGEPLGEEQAEGTDAWAVTHNYVSVTPIHLDLTNHRLLDVLRGWDLRF
jgi:5'-nucleotidase